MALGLYEWTMTRNSAKNMAACSINVSVLGDTPVTPIPSDMRNLSFAVRPVFYLNSNAKIISGEGIISNPYKLSLQ